ncbi:MAG: Nif3-like dinuclear metal center hexameric protein [Gemmatimonadetes bacterium]|nr:Nif3-like dinuclear metal center hexameric protein [Gemmatimonadota bacterium]
MRLESLVSYLDEYLRIHDVADEPEALNGLQVESGGEVRQLVVAVDACLASIAQAAERGADLLIVHHGLFWGGLEPLVGRHYRRVAALMRHGIALYAAHAPLDRHPEIGNNIVLARQLGMDVRGWFGEYRGAAIGVWGELDLPREVLGARLGELLGPLPRLLPGGPERVRRVGVISGGGGPMIRQAFDTGLDTFITGEGPHWTFFEAEELGLNAFFAGHYATETVGVKALGAHLAERFQIPWSFIDHPTGL